MIKGLARSLCFSRKSPLTTGGLLRLAVPVVLLLLRSTQTEAKLQAETATSAPGRFEVASIRANKSGGSRNSIALLPDGLKATNVPRRMLIRMAYGVADDQISAAPAWVNAKGPVEILVINHAEKPSEN